MIFVMICLGILAFALLIFTISLVAVASVYCYIKIDDLIDDIKLKKEKSDMRWY